MIPIYRIRDGKKALANNKAIFGLCAKLLQQHKAIVIFPEANHNLERRVRTLSKGFTRILHAALSHSPDLDIQIVPIGLNYKDAKYFPDSVAIYYGAPIPVRSLYDKDDLAKSALGLKEAVSKQLKQLTTHIAAENYMETKAALDLGKPDYLDPVKTNESLKHLKIEGTSPVKTRKTPYGLGKIVFLTLNFPVMMAWKYIVAPLVPEDEFRSSFRFLYFLLIYPMFYLFLFLVSAFLANVVISMAIVGSLFVFNCSYVKYLADRT